MNKDRLNQIHEALDKLEASAAALAKEITSDGDSLAEEAMAALVPLFGGDKQAARNAVGTAPQVAAVDGISASLQGAVIAVQRTRAIVANMICGGRQE